MTRGRGFSSYRGGSGNRSSWGGPPDSSYNSSHGNSIHRFSSFSSSLDSRSRYTPADRYGGGPVRNPYDDYKSYRSVLSSSYTGRDAHRSPERKRLRDEAPRRSREADNFSSSRYAPSFMDRSFRDRRPPPPPTISRRDDFRRPLPPSSPRGGYRGRLSSRGLRGVRLRDGPPRRRLAESSYAIRRRLPPLLTSDYTRRLKVSRLRSAIARRAAIKRKHESDKEESDDDDDDDEKKSEDEKVKKEKDEKEGSDAEGNVEDDKEGSKKKEDKEKGEEGDKKAKSPKKDFIKLVCPHCNSKCITFGKYVSHLRSSKHMMAMRQVAMKQKTILARMRLSQRNAQRELEKSTEDLAPRTNFCPLCKLNYKQPKPTHQASDTHKTMKKFLMPYCKVCKITFKSPMMYESHICSIEHIKRKARTEVNGDKSDNDSEDLLEHFMTIDSVGEVDDGLEDKRKDKDKSDSEGKKIPVNVGIEQIKKVEVHYCELCRMYLPRVEADELESTLSKHCKQRTHLQRYIRYKEDKEIANRAERLQRKETAEKEREKKGKDEQEKDGEAKAEDTKEDGEEKDKPEEDETMDDKLWADDVNKDLGDILAEAESGNKSSDDEGGERFDRFGTSEKNGDEVKENEEENDKKENADASVESK